MTPFGIEYEEKIVPDAYHGTSKENAQSILTDGFVPTRDKDAYLGDGVYFYESSYASAWDWAVEKREILEDDAVVLKCIIDLGVCLNLQNRDHCKAIIYVKNVMESKGKKNPTDASVINYFAENILEVDTIRNNFIRGFQRKPKKLFSGSRLYDNSELYICVRNTSRILNTKIVERSVS